MSSSFRNNNIDDSSANNDNSNIYLDELALLNNGLTVTDNDRDHVTSSSGVGVEDDADECGATNNDTGGDTSSFVIPTSFPPLPVNNDGGEQRLLLQQQQERRQWEGGQEDAGPPAAAAPSSSLASANAAMAMMAPTDTPSSQRKHVPAVLQSSKSNIQFRTDLSKSDRDSHPCGILHFTRSTTTGHDGGGGAPEEHVFAWISHFHNPIHLENTLLHLQTFGFLVASSSPSSSSGESRINLPNYTNANTTVTFLPYSSRRSWIEKYPRAFPHVYCGENGVVSGYPYWSERGVSDNIIRAGGGGTGCHERMMLFQAMNHGHLSSSATIRYGGGELEISSLPASTAIGPTTSYNAKTADADSTEKNPAAPFPSSTRGRKTKKLFPTAHLPNEERDELHIEIYKYFEWLHNSLVAASTLTSGTAMAAAAGSERCDDKDELLGEKKERSASLISIGGGRSRSAEGCGGGIDFSSLNQLMKCMESTFKVIGNSQRTQSSFTATATTSPTNAMPFLEEALSEPLRNFALIANRNPENQPRSQKNRDRRGSATSISGGNSTGIDFEDMFKRLLQFQQEHGHVNVPQKYAPDGQLGSWVANIRSKRKLMSRRGLEFEPDFASSSIPDPMECENLVADANNNTDFEHDGEGSNIGLGDEDDCGGSGGEHGVVSENFYTKKRKHVGGRQRLTQERVHRLDTIGFQWVVSNSSIKSWEERFANLKEYQQYHGTTRVPRSSGTLGEWVHMQRRLYNKKDKTFLSTRAPLLDAIGFEWHPRKYTSVSWEDNFNRLVDFGRMHGHYNVQSPFPDNYHGNIEDQDAKIIEAHRFAKWVKRIHAEYRSYVTGKEGCMLTDARVMQLHEIGFQFA